MAGIREIKNRLERLRDNLPKIAEESVYASKNEFEETQKDQLFKGSDSRGRSFKQYRDPEYARMKNIVNPLPGLGYPDLYLTGAFYNGIYVTIRGGKLIVGSTDNKAPMLERKYKYVFGLSPDDMTAFIYNSLKPVYQKKVVESFKS